MKKSYKYFLLLAAIGCATHVTKKSVEVIAPPDVTPVPTGVFKTPRYVLPTNYTAPKEYPQAIALIDKYGNSDEFFAYAKAKRTYYSHLTTDIEAAVKKFRDCLSTTDDVHIQFYNPTIPSKAIGAWNGYVMRQNTEHKLNVIERSGHLFHETSHKCGFRHNGNYADKFDNYNSFPYAMGYDFEDFLTGKLKPTLAGE